MATKKKYSKNRSASKGTAKQTQRATTNKKHGKGKHVGITLLVVLLVLALAVIGVGAAYYVTDGFGTKKESVFLIRSGGEAYSKNADGIKLASGTEFAVECLAGETEYTVSIGAKGTAENDFEFQIGEEKGYHWKDQDGKDFTDGFKITKSETGFKVEYEDLTKIITAAKGTTATLLSESAGGDLFTLTVTCGKSSIGLNFSLYYKVGDVTVDPPSTVFPIPDEKPDGGGQPSEGQDPDENDPSKQETAVGVYKFYSIKDGDTTHYVGDTVSAGLGEFTYTGEYMEVELRADGFGTLKTKVIETTEETIVWEADVNDPNKITISNADGTGASVLTKDGEYIRMETNDGKQYTLKKQAQEQSERVQDLAGTVNTETVEEEGGNEQT